MANSLQGTRARPVARLSGRIHTRHVVFLAVLLAYTALTLAVVHRAPLTTVDQRIVGLDLMKRWPGIHTTISALVILGQRGPSTLVALPWILWRTWRMRSSTPILRLVLALIMLNGSVGVVKILTGRLGPLRTTQAGAVFDHGNIFPSGHVSNAVVLFGVLAFMAVRYRKTAIAVAVTVPIVVGACTIYLDTHWFTDVLGGWFAGALILLALPTVMPTADRWTTAIGHRLARPVVSRRPSTDEPSITLLPALPQPNRAPARSSARPQPFAPRSRSREVLVEPTRRG